MAMHNKTRSQRDMSHAVLFATGPWLLRDAFKEFSGEAGDLATGYAGEHTVKGTHVMVYALGQWCAAPPTLSIVPLPSTSSCSLCKRKHLTEIAMRSTPHCLTCFLCIDVLLLLV